MGWAAPSSPKTYNPFAVRTHEHCSSPSSPNGSTLTLLVISGDPTMDGDLRRMSIKYGKLPINPNPLLNRGVQINSHTMQNETAEAVICYSKKLEDTLREIGFKIKHHEDNMKFLKAQKNKLNNSILDIEGLSQIILGSKPCWQLFAWHVMDLKHRKHMIRKVLLIKVLVFTDLELQLEDLWMTNILSSVLRT